MGKGDWILQNTTTRKIKMARIKMSNETVKNQCADYIQVNQEWIYKTKRYGNEYSFNLFFKIKGIFTMAMANRSETIEIDTEDFDAVFFEKL
jgi:hypothetical protein